MKSYTKQSLIQALWAIRERGWILNARPRNDGGVGNTLEDLLEIPENNLPLANAAEWELKCHRANTSSLLTLCHLDPSPRAYSLVTRMLLPKYGWPHQLAGTDYPIEEQSFRQTIRAGVYSDRGFTVVVDRAQARVAVSFDASQVSARHHEWLETVRQRAGLGELDPLPYWGVADLLHKIGSKLHNCFLIVADVKRERGQEFYRYTRILMLQDLAEDRLIDALASGIIRIDFDARSGHNHGTKFRLPQVELPSIYSQVFEL